MLHCLWLLDDPLAEREERAEYYLPPWRAKGLPPNTRIKFLLAVPLVHQDPRRLP